MIILCAIWNLFLKICNKLYTEFITKDLLAAFLILILCFLFFIVPFSFVIVLIAGYKTFIEDLSKTEYSIFLIFNIIINTILMLCIPLPIIGTNTLFYAIIDILTQIAAVNSCILLINIVIISLFNSVLVSCKFIKAKFKESLEECKNKN